jgi:hypothetical protein
VALAPDDTQSAQPARRLLSFSCRKPACSACRTNGGVIEFLAIIWRFGPLDLAF